MQSVNESYITVSMEQYTDVLTKLKEQTNFITNYKGKSIW